MPETATFNDWLKTVAIVTWNSLERDLADLDSELGPLPFDLGWQSGDSAAEFVAGAIAPLLEQGAN